MANSLNFNVNRAFDDNGDPVPGAKAYFYLSGTTTPHNVYTDSGGLTVHPVPLVADSEGIFPPAFEKDGQAVKVLITNAADVTLTGYPIDPAISVEASGGAAAQTSFAPTVRIPAPNVQSAIEMVSDDSLQVASNLSDLASASAALVNLGITSDPERISTLGGNPTTITDWDAIAVSGFYFALSTAANAPSAHKYSGIYSGNATDGYLVVGRAGADVNFTRRRGGGFWGLWVPVNGGWVPADGFDGVKYDFAVNGSVASVPSSVWEDGWEYMLVYDGVGGASGNLMLSLERESGGFSGAVAISGTGNVVHYGELVFQLPRMEKFSHIATETTASLAAPANTFTTNVTYQSCGITHAVATKIKSAVLTNSAGNITSGKVYEFRRPEGTS